MAASTTPPSQSLNRRLLFGLPLLAAAFAYANAVLNGFVLDDYHIILENPDVLGDLNFFAVTDRMSGTYYRPISVFTFWLDHRIFGFWAGGFHLTGVLYHGAVTLLAVQLCRRLFSDQVALFAGLIFAVHPVHTEAVTAIANRTEILATGFCLLALLVHLRPGKDGALRIAGENALLLLGLLSKESALTLPLMIFAVDWLKPGGRLRVTGPLRVVPAIALYFWIKTAAIGIAGFEAEHGYFYGATLGERIFSVMAVMWRYVGVLLWPTNLSASYEQAFLSAPSLSAVLGAASVVAVAVAILSTQRSGTPVALGLALMAAAMAPYLHLQSMMIVMADRFMYLPSVGFCMVAGYGLERLLSRLPRRALRIAVPLVLVATLSLLTATGETRSVCGRRRSSAAQPAPSRTATWASRPFTRETSTWPSGRCSARSSWHLATSPIPTPWPRSSTTSSCTVKSCASSRQRRERGRPIHTSWTRSIASLVS